MTRPVLAVTAAERIDEILGNLESKADGFRHIERHLVRASRD